MAAVTSAMSVQGSLMKAEEQKLKQEVLNKKLGKGAEVQPPPAETSEPVQAKPQPHGDELHTSPKGSEPIGGNEEVLASEQQEASSFKMKGFSGFGNK
tara:strand:- start:914 stop:1207 length:294 start_codon:yes stop_codon:yes gene_type:complete